MNISTSLCVDYMILRCCLNFLMLLSKRQLSENYFISSFSSHIEQDNQAKPKQVFLRQELPYFYSQIVSKATLRHCRPPSSQSHPLAMRPMCSFPVLKPCECSRLKIEKILRGCFFLSTLFQSQRIRIPHSMCR